MPKIDYTAPDWLLDAMANGELDSLPRTKMEKLNTILQANEILEEYEEQGYTLTLRQLYYQFVARDLIPNTSKSYKKLGTIISDGRLWGLIDWDQLEDRGRNFEQRTHWETPSRLINATVHSFAVDKWADSPDRFEVWVEKQALEDIVSRACRPYDVGYISCKGYMSQSEMWAASERIKQFQDHQSITILHLGDHDPSGIDMTRDIRDRLRIFGCEVYVHRIALNMDQIDQYSPPPNPTKITDTRADKYIDDFGTESWELDALAPDVIETLIEDELYKAIDQRYYDKEDVESQGKEQLRKCSDNWHSVVNFLDKKD